MERLTLTDTNIDAVTKMAEGNPGATQALCELLTHKPAATLKLLYLDSLGIYGSSIYILWSDQCDRDIDKFVNLLTASQMGTFDSERLKRLAADQMGTEKITEEEFAALA